MDDTNVRFRIWPAFCYEDVPRFREKYHRAALTDEDNEQ